MSHPYLYINTTSSIVIGILDSSNFSFIDYIKIDKRKGASFFHKELDLILKNNNLDLINIKDVIICSGPGSYTGMRLSEGPAQILEWQNKTIYSFYSFEIPQFNNINKGVFIANAFKGEIFYFSWDNGNELHGLIKLEKLDSIINSHDECFSISDNIEISKKITNIDDLILKNSSRIFPHIIKRKKHMELFYFRPTEIEFLIPKR